MQNTQPAQTQLTSQVYQHAANLLVTQKLSPDEVIESLTASGLSEDNARNVVQTVHEQINNVLKDRANKDMLYGGLWCVGGLIATMADIGFIFWGAIIFGGVQLVKGIVNYTSIK